MRKLLGPIVACALLLGVAGVAGACPGCKESIPGAAAADGGPGGPSPGLPVGFNYSIYVMLGGLFSVMAMVGGIIVKGVRSTNPADSRGFPVTHPPISHPRNG
jgi:hypothetical protein